MLAQVAADAFSDAIANAASAEFFINTFMVLMPRIIFILRDLSDGVFINRGDRGWLSATTMSPLSILIARLVWVEGVVRMLFDFYAERSTQLGQSTIVF